MQNVTGLSVSPVQSKMARVALGLGIRELAKLANVSPTTIARLERGDELRASTVSAIRAALESAGVIFVEENGEGPGVRLRKAKPGPIPADSLNASNDE